MRNTGKFFINRETIGEGTLPTLFRLFGKMIVIKCEFCFAENSFEYTAFSPELFRRINLGESVPYYAIEMSLDFFNTEIKAREVKGGYEAYLFITREGMMSDFDSEGKGE